MNLTTRFTQRCFLLHLVNLRNHRTASMAFNSEETLPSGLDCASTRSQEGPVGKCAQVALITKQVCDEVGLKAFPKTSGSSGIHIYLPLKNPPTNTRRLRSLRGCWQEKLQGEHQR